MTTGWPQPALAQDDCRQLFEWFASKTEARRLVRERAANIRDLKMQMPDFDFDTASHTGSRIRGYSKETLTRFAADLEAAQQEIARLRAALALPEDVRRAAVEAVV